MSTPDIRITLRRDVKEGNIKIENYISDFEIIKKTLDELQMKLNAMDVVRKSGDTMPGNLLFDRAGTANTNKIAFSTAGVEELNLYQTGMVITGLGMLKEIKVFGIIIVTIKRLMFPLIQTLLRKLATS